MSKKIAIIGSGFSSMSAASYLAKSGFKVNVYEKNKTLGGRARQLKKDGFTFDMGPSWYWMPDVFESFFNDFGKKTADFYKLERLDPGYQVFFGENESICIGDSLEKICNVFEKEEKGSGEKGQPKSGKKNYGNSRQSAASRGLGGGLLLGFSTCAKGGAIGKTLIHPLHRLRGVEQLTGEINEKETN